MKFHWYNSNLWCMNAVSKLIKKTFKLLWCQHCTQSALLRAKGSIPLIRFQLMLYPKVISKNIIFKVYVHHIFHLKTSGFVLSSWNLINLEIGTFSILTWKKKKSSCLMFCRSENSWKQDIIHLYDVFKKCIRICMVPSVRDV